MQGDELPDDKIKKIEDARRQSSEIVSIASTMKESGGVQAGINAEIKKLEREELEDEEHGIEAAVETGNLLDCCTVCFGNGNEARKAELENLKKEIEITWHTDDICKVKDQYKCDFKVTYDQNDNKKWTVSDIKGLSVEQSEILREEYGLNQLTPAAKKSELVKFCEQLTGFFSLLLWSGGILCFIGYGLQGAQDNLYLGIVLFIVVFLTGLFGYVQEKKSSDLMDSFTSMMPKNCELIRSGATCANVDAKNIVPGDIIVVKYGCAVPADMRIIKTNGTVSVDNSSLTGEADPQKRSTEETDKNPLETKNLCFFGTSVMKGTATGICVATGDHTVMGRIARLAEGTSDEDSPIAKEIHHFVLIVSGVAFVLGITFFIVGFILGTDIITNLVFMIGIIVANVPEGLLATLTVCMALTSYRMATNNVLVKLLEGVETLGSTSCICSDKTGTLTQNDMTVEAVCVDGRRFNALCGKNTEDPGIEKARLHGSMNKLLRVATLCNNVKWDHDSLFFKKTNPKYNKNGTEAERQLPPRIPDTKRVKLFMEMVTKQIGGGATTEIPKYNWRPISDATECALAKFAQLKNDIMGERAAWPKITEVAFNSKNKYQISICHDEVELATGGFRPAKSIIILMKGAPERVIGRCDKIWHEGKLVDFTQAHQDKINDLMEECSRDGLRVLGFAEYEMTGDDIKKYQVHDKQKNMLSAMEFPWNLDKNNFPAGADPGPKVHPDSTQKLHFCGLYAMIDPERPQVPGAVHKCKTAGIRVIMVTGDHPMTAQAIAKKCGIIWGDAERGGQREGQKDDFGPSTWQEYEKFNKKYGLSKESPGPKECRLTRMVSKGDGPKVEIPLTDDLNQPIVLKNVMYFDPRLAPAVVVPGWEINGNESNEEFWEDVLAHTQIVFARTSPQQKLVIVENCQKSGEIVAVTGDGVNDAPALKKADIGIAMGIMGSDVSKDAADMILLDDNFASIVSGVEEGRLIFDNLKKSIAYTLSSNIPEIAPFICFILIFLPLPLSTVLILCIDLGTDMVPAISMAWENKESDIMLRPPREAGRDRLVTRKLVFFSYLQIGVIQAIASFYTWFVVMYDYGYPAHILPRLGAYDAWGKQLLWCKPDGDDVKFRGYNGDLHVTWKDIKADYKNQNTTSNLLQYFPFMDGDGDDVKECTYASKNLKGRRSESDVVGGVSDAWAWSGDYAEDEVFAPNDGTYASGSVYKVMEAAGYVPYIPFRAVRSPFFRGKWMKMPFSSSRGAVGFGSASGAITEMYQPGGVYLLKARDAKEVNGAWTCGYTVNGVYTQTVPFESDLESGSKDKSFKMADIFDDGDCEVNYRCYEADGTPHVVSASCKGYDNEFDQHHYYANTATWTVPDPDSNAVITVYKGSDDCNAKTNTVTGWATELGVTPGTSDGVSNSDEVKLEVFPTWSTLCSKDMGGNACGSDGADKCANVASRNSMFEALTHAQCAYFVSIVIVQWADLIICKTRMNSIYHQGMLNPIMNYALIFETLLAAILCYTPGLTIALGTRPLKFLHWMPGVPYSIFIFCYDESRKYIMRSTVDLKVDKQTGQVIRIPGWVERNTYY